MIFGGNCLLLEHTGGFGVKFTALDALRLVDPEHDYLKVAASESWRKSRYDFFEKIYFHKTNLQKNHTYNTKHTIYKRKEIKAKKRLEILREGRKRNGGSHYVIQSIERHNPFKLFSL